jgi:glyoxalase family protein
MSIDGIHHVTSVSGAPADTVRFYREVLGLRLLKKTVNFDDPGTYHLYFGDEAGSPGTSLTFFPYGEGRRGQAGRGQVTTTAFRVRPGALDYWTDRLAEHGIDAERAERLGEERLRFTADDGLAYELVVDDSGDDLSPWAEDVPAEHAIRGFHGVTLTLGEAGPTAEVLETMGAEREAEADGVVRYRLRDGGPGQVVDLDVDPDAPPGRGGPGTVHHVAFRVADDDAQAEWQERLRDAGQRVTEVKDRRYFRSVYFREPGGVLFEIATDGPGFTRDQDVAELGEGLSLPPWLEDDRERIEAALPDLDAAEVAR